MAAKRSKSTWVAPRSGGYSARSAASGRSMKQATAKPKPPTERGSASISEKRSK
jgi:hypothetical protein